VTETQTIKNDPGRSNMSSITQSAPPALSERRAGPPRWKQVLETYALVVILLLVIVGFSVAEPESFATKDNFVTILQQESVLACLCLGLLLPIAAGEFDLSVGYVVGFSAILAAALGGKTGMPGGLVVVAVLLSGLLIGTLNGVLVAHLKVNSLIATLGVGFGVSALATGVSGSQVLFHGIPDVVPSLANTSILGLRSAVWVVAALAIVVFLMLTFTPFGKKIYAVGGSERVTRMAGVRTSAVKVAAFALCGGFAALAGLLNLGQAGAANPSFGLNLLLPAFAAVFLGATTIRPGVFNVWGTIIAILLLATAFVGLGLAGVPLWIEPLFDGVLLLGGVILARSEARSLG
jgi:ribose transport system permease protein